MSEAEFKPGDVVALKSSVLGKTGVVGTGLLVVEAYQPMTVVATADITGEAEVFYWSDDGVLRSARVPPCALVRLTVDADS